MVGGGLWASVLVVAATAATAQAATTETGYLPMQDGIELKYTLKLPDGKGPVPVVLTYDGYDSGVTGGSSVVGGADELNKHGYAALGVNVRGTGCSGGVWEMFPRQWGLDGAAVIEWAARQPWSTGKVAEMGHSFAGFAAWGVAGERPPHLAALDVAVTDGDFYRDAVYPGGIYNVLLSEAFVVGQQNNSQGGAQAAISSGDATCAANYAANEARYAPGSTSVQTAAHQFHDNFWETNAREQYFGKVTVPVLASNPWQDGIAGSGVFGYELGLVRNDNHLWFVGSNGDHDQFDVTPEILFRFFDHYLKRADNGWQAEPHIRLWQDSSQAVGARRVRPGSEIDIGDWPLPVQTHELFLRAGNALSDAPPPAARGADSYPYPRLAANALNTSDNKDQDLWKQPFDTAGAVVFTTAPLTHDVVLAGPASLDVWLASTAIDTDVQATLTELRPDGQEVYLQRGWLRMSARKLDAKRSSDLEPISTGLQQDAQPLVAGTPTFGRLRIFPFSKELRRGSRLRLIIDAPTAPTGVHGFAFYPTAATNSIYHDVAHPSVLRVGVLAGQHAEKPMPGCGHNVSEPCRPDPFGSLPTGTEPVFVGTETSILPAARGCLGRRHFVIRLGRRAIFARIKVSHRPVKVLRGKRLRTKIDLRGLPRGRFTVAITVRTRNHRIVRTKRTYRPCTPKRRSKDW
jgi:uncharacterized protein